MKETKLDWSRVRWTIAVVYFCSTVLVFLWSATKDEKLSLTFSQQDLKVRVLEQNPRLRLQLPNGNEKTLNQTLQIDLPTQDLNLRLPETEITTNLTVPTTVTRLQELIKAISAPLALIFIAIEINQTYDRRSRQKDREYREDERQKDLIKDYLEQITKLLVDRELADKNPDDRASVAAKALTVAVIKELQPGKIKQLVNFLVVSSLSSSNEEGPNLLVDVNFNRTHLEGADFSNTNLNKAQFESSSLKEANLYRSDLKEANFEYANLEGANLSKTNLYKANLSYADLSYANFKETDLNEAYIDEANLSEAKNLTGEQIIKARLWDRARLKGKWTFDETKRSWIPANDLAESENEDYVKELEELTKRLNPNKTT